MSDFMKGIEKSFDKSTKQLDKLTDDLNKLADLEAELSEASGSLNLGAVNLRKVTGEHSKFIAAASEANNQLKDVVKELKSFEPKILDEKLTETKGLIETLSANTEELEKALNEKVQILKEEIQSNQKSVSRINKFLLFMFACQAVGFILLVYRLY